MCLWLGQIQHHKYKSNAFSNCPFLPHMYFRYLAFRAIGQRYLILVGQSDENSPSTRPKADLFPLVSIPNRRAEFLKQGHRFTWKLLQLKITGVIFHPDFRYYLTNLQVILNVQETVFVCLKKCLSSGKVIKNEIPFCYSCLLISSHTEFLIMTF